MKENKTIYTIYVGKENMTLVTIEETLLRKVGRNDA
jgi:hypothetical protein